MCSLCRGRVSPMFCRCYYTVSRYNKISNFAFRREQNVVLFCLRLFSSQGKELCRSRGTAEPKEDAIQFTPQKITLKSR
jgi:hypothetical protein